MRWEEVCDVAGDWAHGCQEVSAQLRKQAATYYTQMPAGYYHHPVGAIAIHGVVGDDLARCIKVASSVVGPDSVIPVPLSTQEASSGEWIKVAYSPTLRRLGEYLNFFPGKYPGGIPNAPSPLAAILTTALVGGGLGYGLGALGERVLPERYGRKLKRTGTLAGAALGGAAASPWLVANSLQGKSPLDASTLDTPAGAEPTPDLAAHALNDQEAPSESLLRPLADLYDPRRSHKHAMDLLESIPLGRRYLHAVEEFTKRAFTLGRADLRQRTPYDVNVNALGQTLWETGASPAMAASTMGAMYAAQQMPDEESRPGYATGHQLGQLAMNAGKDYAKGLVFGALVNSTLGTPYTSPQMGLASVGLGILRSAVSGLLA